MAPGRRPRRRGGRSEPPQGPATVIILPVVAPRRDGGLVVQVRLEADVYARLLQLAHEHWDGIVGAAATDLLSLQIKSNQGTD